jgi:hypothetical protein
MRSLGLIEEKLSKYPPEEKAAYHKEKQKENFDHRPSQDQTSESSGNKKSKT